MDRMESWKIQFFNDKYMMKIVKSLLNSPKSAGQISRECDIPIATVYRKLQALQGRQLLKTSGFITDDGMRTTSYQTNKMMTSHLGLDYHKE